MVRRNDSMTFIMYLRPLLSIFAMVLYTGKYQIATMTIEFVNHASIIVDHDNIRLLCDPWTEGTAFHNGWSLLAKSKFTFDDYKNITHIWFSHEHPDHFSPPNIS